MEEEKELTAEDVTWTEVIYYLFMGMLVVTGAPFGLLVILNFIASVSIPITFWTWLTSAVGLIAIHKTVIYFWSKEESE